LISKEFQLKPGKCSFKFNNSGSITNIEVLEVQFYVLKHVLEDELDWGRVKKPGKSISTVFAPRKEIAAGVNT
jgi:hypothetical protein